MSSKKLIQASWLGIALLWVVSFAEAITTSSRLPLELVSYLTLFLIFLSHPAVQRMLIAAGVVRSVVFIAAILVLIYAQIHDRRRTFFPAAAWNMYSIPHPSRIVYSQLVVIDREGNEINLRPWSRVDGGYERPIYAKMHGLPHESEALAEAIRYCVAVEAPHVDIERIEWRRWEADPRVKPVGSKRDIIKLLVLSPEGDHHDR